MLKHYMCVRQHDAADCGAACLSTVLRQFGARVSIARLREYARTDQGGTTVLGLVEAAHRLGFHARGVKGGPEALPGIQVPAIAHVVTGHGSHYVVVHRVAAKHLVVADPAHGIRKISRAEFLAVWTGILVLVAPAQGLLRERGRRALRVPLLRWVLPQKRLLGAAVSAAFLFTMLGMTGSVFLQLLVDRVLVLRDAAILWRLTFVVIALSVCRAGLGFARGVLIARVGQRMDASLMLDYLHHVLHVPLRFFETRNTGEILARFSDIVKVRDVIGGSAVVVLVDASTMVAGFCFLFYYNRALAVVSMALWTLPLLAACSANSSLRRHQRLALEQAANVQSCLVESLSGIATVKALSAEEAVFRKAQVRIGHLLDLVFRTWTVAISASAAGEACSSLSALSILGAAGFMVIEGHMSPGEMVAFYSILSLMLQPIQRLISANQAIQDAVIAAERLEDTMDLEKEPPEGTPIPSAVGRIESKGVSFGYSMGDPVIRNVSFTVPSCSITAVVGPSGSGKSTIAKLLMRLYLPQSGTIELDGVEISRITISDLRRQVRYVGPDAFLFSGTLRDNLLLGGSGAGEDSMRAALSAVGLSWLTELPGYLDVAVGEHGAGFSAGQKQQLAIAQALLSRPRVLILDEATSHLDAGAEEAVLRHLHTLRDCTTVIVIGHAVPHALDVDQVLTVRAGTVVLETDLPAGELKYEG